MAVADNGFEIFPIGFTEAVRPWIGSKNLALFFILGSDPGERRDSRIGEAPVSDALRLFEGFDQADRRPGIFVDDLLFHHGHMHDREDAGLLKIFALYGFIVGE